MKKQIYTPFRIASTIWMKLWKKIQATSSSIYFCVCWADLESVQVSDMSPVFTSRVKVTVVSETFLAELQYSEYTEHRIHWTTWTTYVKPPKLCLIHILLNINCISLSAIKSSLHDSKHKLFQLCCKWSASNFSPDTTSKKLIIQTHPSCVHCGDRRCGTKGIKRWDD